MAIIVFNAYKTAYKKEEKDERTGMGVEGRVCEESGEEVELESAKITRENGGVGLKDGKVV